MKRYLSGYSAFVVGGAIAVSGHLAMGMLLFADEGMFRALTIILGIELGALALGLGSRVSPDDPRVLETLRHRWIFLLVTFVPATAFSLVWTFTGGLGATGAAQGLGLALLGALPIYAGGGVLAAMAGAHRSGCVSSPGGPAALGACTGVLVTGTVGITSVGAPSLLLFSLMLLSSGALVQGWFIEDEGEEDLGESEEEPGEGSEADPTTPAVADVEGAGTEAP